MFQKALVRRTVDVIGMRPPVFGLSTMNHVMPCLSAVLPVAIEVHRMGDSMGSMEANFALVPSRSRLARWGRSPAAIRRSRMLQSAPSMPTMRMVGAGALPHPATVNTSVAKAATMTSAAVKREASRYRAIADRSTAMATTPPVTVRYRQRAERQRTWARPWQRRGVGYRPRVAARAAE